LEKQPHYGKIFKIPFRKNSPPIDVSCANFVKFGRGEVGESVRCLPDKKIRLALPLSVCAGRAQSLPGLAPDNVLGVL